MELHLRTFLWLLLLGTMVGCFMAQMWEQFVKYLKVGSTESAKNLLIYYFFD